MFRLGSEFPSCMVYGLDDLIGTCVDLYFDDSEWIIRYFVIEMTEPEVSTRVLVASEMLTKLDMTRKEIFVKLLIDKIRNSPEIDTNLPISRQYEIALRRYYEWPIYWGQSSFLDTPDVNNTDEETLPMDETGRPIQEKFSDNEDEPLITDTSDEEIPNEPDEEEFIEAEFGQSEENLSYSTQLRSLSDLKGYRIQTTDSDNSTIDDLILDESDMAVRYLVINLRNSHEGQRVIMTLQWVQQIDWGSNRVFSTLSQTQLENAPSYTPGQNISQEFEQAVFAYYDSI